jgi:protein involved in polysaccharide export with SLBB domain
MKPGSLRRCTSLLLVVSLLAPGPGVAQIPSPSPPLPPPGGAPRPVAPAPVAPPPLVTPPVPAAPPAPAALPAAVSSAPRGLTPGPDYRLNAGDLLDVQIAGRLDVIRQQTFVDLEGVINVPPLGAIPVGGLSLLEAHRRVSERARDVFKFADATITVVAPRTFEVIVSGEVERPGTVQTTAMRRVFDVILDAGGITARGSTRNIALIRRSGERQADLLAFRLRGDLAQNPFVEEGLRIHVPPRSGTVTLSGAVRRPGEYEIGSTPSLRQLLELVGGPSQTAALGDARLTRVGAGDRREATTLDLRAALTPATDVTLRPGDAIYVPSTSSLQDVIEIRGAFNGTAESTKTTVAGKQTILQRFELAQGERVRDVLDRAGGAAAYADLRLALVERSGPTGPRQRIPIDLYRMLVDKDDAPNIVLQNGDVFMLPIVEDKIFILGEVRTPGAHEFRPDLTPREYVALAGGPTNRARLVNTVVTFRSGKTYAMADAPPLEPGAVVTVPEVAVKWWQDYLTIVTAIATLVTAYTGLYFIFNGQASSN